MATKHDFHKVIIGRSEELDFIDFDITRIPAKTDTGAYRSAVHASNIEESDGNLRFELLTDHPICGTVGRTITTDVYKKVIIENSFGHREERYEVALRVKLGPKIFTARFTLANRAKKIYPILLGRKLLNHRFLVDSSKSSIDRVHLKEKYGISFPIDEEGGKRITSLDQ